MVVGSRRVAKQRMVPYRINISFKKCPLPATPKGLSRGVVFVNGTNVNLEMVRLGLAEVYRGRQPRYFNATIYNKAEAEAKRLGIGIWFLGDKYVSPKEWRKMRRKDM
jgi:endonuclease YncB( thermonuclease family)